MPEWLVSGLVAAIASWGAIRMELRYLRRDIDGAHRRLDNISAPAAWVELKP